jgi:hypothetical protein
MAIGGTIYGFVETPWGLKNEDLRRHNLQVLEQVPMKDEWPPLIRPMFGITGPSVGEGAYDHDLIHFGVTLKGMDDEDGLNWIAKFESLLARLSWYEAVMHIHWCFGDRKFSWVADKDQLEQLGLRSRMTIDRWRFDDGGEPLG